MRLAALFSGGKDSAYSIYIALKEKHDIKYLVTMHPQNTESYMFHTLNLEMTDLQSKALQIPLVKGTTKGVEGAEVADLKKLVAQLDVDGMLVGSFQSTYQRKRFEILCEELNLELVAPLWGLEPEHILRDAVEKGFEIIVVGVFAEGFNKEWLGRKIDLSCIEALKELHSKYGIHIAGEGGEYETLVLAAPIFKNKIVIKEQEIVWKNTYGYLIVRSACLV